MVNFKTMPFVLSVCVVLAAALASCSVKENRNDCPCSLMLDFSEVDSVVVKSVIFWLYQMMALSFMISSTLRLSRKHM